MQLVYDMSDKVFDRSKRDKKWCIHYRQDTKRCLLGYCKKRRLCTDGSCSTNGRTEHWDIKADPDKGVHFDCFDKMGIV